MDLTTVSRIKTLDKSYENGSRDAKLAMVITGVSAKIESYLDRTIEIGSYIEFFNVLSSKSRYHVPAYPVTDVSYIYNLSEREDTTPYEIDLDLVSWEDNSLGYISINDSYIYSGFGSVKISYTGGMATDTADFISKYPDIAYQVDAQVLFEMQALNNLQDKIVAVEDQTITKNPYGLLPGVTQALNKHKNKKMLY